MGIYIERYNGPSKLEERLEEFRVPESGRILITPGEARDLLLQALIGFYRKTSGHMDEKVLALLNILGADNKDERYDFAEKLDIVREARRTVADAVKEIERIGSVISPHELEQPEI